VRCDAHVAWCRVLPHTDRAVVDTGGHQFLLRTEFEPVAGWLGAPDSGGPRESTGWSGAPASTNRRYARAVETNDAAASTADGMQNDTPALRALAGSDLRFEVVRFERPTSARESADRQGIELGALLRTIVVRRGADDYLFVLVPGGRQISWPKLRSHLGVKRLSLPDADEAREATGYERGAITPFGSTHAWPVIADRAVAAHELVAIGGGAHGINLHLTPSDLIGATNAVVADIADEADEAEPR
jgi:Cys-tRNA(Pro)/Cys-tRNA(Cys) deacylase